MNKILLDNKLVYYQVFFKNNKNMYMRVKNNQVIITAPKHFDYQKVEKFMIKNQRFILNHLHQSLKPLYNTKTFLLWGKTYNIINHENNFLSIVGQSAMLPFVYENKNIEKFYRYETIKKAEEIIEKEFKFLLIEIDLENIILKSQLMKTRLGSCNPRTKSINLNSVLARFDSLYLRAVLLHEIIHLKETNHQKGFYDLLLRYEPQYKEIRKNLNKIIKEYQI